MNRVLSDALRHALLIGCCFGPAVVAPAWAQVQPQAQERIRFDIPAQNLGSALTELAQQIRKEIVVASDAVRDRSAPELRGEFTPTEALGVLLKDTGLRHRISTNGTIVVEAVHEFDIPPQALIGALEAFTRITGQQVDVDARAMRGKNSAGLTGSYSAREGLRQLLVGTGFKAHQHADTGLIAIRAEGPGAEGSASAGEPSSTVGEAQTTRADIEEGDDQIVVTGSRIPTTNSSQPIRSYTDEDIRTSGQTTIASFLNTIPQVSTAISEVPNQTPGAKTTVQLRGLPVGTTLVLLNGRRINTNGLIGARGGSYFDLNSIPQVAVQRIEIIPQGSSAIYGSDALAGVVNIILNDRLDGASLDARYAFADGFDEGLMSASFGQIWTNGRFHVSVTHLTRSELSGDERDILANEDYTRFGGPDLRTSACNPANIFEVSGVPTLSLNLCGLRGETTVRPAVDRTSVIANGSYDLSSSVEAFTELLFTRQNSHSQFANQTFFAPLPFPAANPFNTEGRDLLANYQFTSDGTAYTEDLREEFYRALIGFRGDFSPKWSWELAAWQTGDSVKYDLINYSLNYDTIFAALASTDPTTAFNPFAADPVAPELLDSLFISALDNRFKGKTLAANALIRGAIFRLPAGDVQVAAGVEVIRDTIISDSPALYGEFKYRRTNYAPFAEVRIPIIPGRNERVTPALTLTAAVRYDKPTDFGGQVTPQIGLEANPVPGLSLRAAYAEAYRAPGLFQLNQPAVRFPGLPVMDPARGDELVFVDFIIGGNDNLKPETGKSFSAGGTWTPAYLPGLTMAANWFSVQQFDRVAQIFPDTLLANEALFPGRVTRAPSADGSPGAITLLDFSYLNFGELKVEGLDFDISYPFEGALGKWRPGVSLTHIYKYDATVLAAIPVVSRVDKADGDGWAPSLKAVAFLDWSSGRGSARVAGRYVSEYEDYSSTRKLGGFFYWDLSANYELKGLLGSSFLGVQGSRIGISVTNLFDEQPAYSSFTSSLPYDPTQYDIVGRFVAINLGVSW